MTPRKLLTVHMRLEEMHLHVEYLMVETFGERAAELRDLWRVQYIEHEDRYRVEIGDTHEECPQFAACSPEVAVSRFKAEGLYIFRARVGLLDQQEDGAR